MQKSSSAALTAALLVGAQALVSCGSDNSAAPSTAVLGQGPASENSGLQPDSDNSPDQESEPGSNGDGAVSEDGANENVPFDVGEAGASSSSSDSEGDAESTSEDNSEVGEVPSDTGGTGEVFPAGMRPRVMIVGDSISAGPGCYKGYLQGLLEQNGYTNLDFVGEYTDDCGGGVMHSAVSCSTAGQYTQPSFTLANNCSDGVTYDGLAALAATHEPDMIMLQLGVNDVWNGRAVDAILGDYAELVAQARAQNPSIVLVVAQIQQIRPDCDPADATVFDRAQSVVEAVPAWAEGLSTSESPVFVADLWTNSDWTIAETNDCVHPNDVGAERMGQNWFDALRNILSPN